MGDIHCDGKRLMSMIFHQMHVMCERMKCMKSSALMNTILRWIEHGNRIQRPTWLGRVTEGAKVIVL